MRSLTTTLLSLSVLSQTLGAFSEPQISPYRLHEKRTHVPDGWSYSHKHHSSSVLALRFGLTQPNIGAIAEFIGDVSHPDSPNYGKHWTPAQVAAKFAPADESVQAVKGWLIQNGFEEGRIRVTTTKSWIGTLTLS